MILSGTVGHPLTLNINGGLPDIFPPSPLPPYPTLPIHRLGALAPRIRTVSFSMGTLVPRRLGPAAALLAVMIDEAYLMVKVAVFGGRDASGGTVVSDPGHGFSCHHALWWSQGFPCGQAGWGVCALLVFMEPLMSGVV